MNLKNFLKNSAPEISSGIDKQYLVTVAMYIDETKVDLDIEFDVLKDNEEHRDDRCPTIINLSYRIFEDGWDELTGLLDMPEDAEEILAEFVLEEFREMFL